LVIGKLRTKINVWIDEERIGTLVNFGYREDYVRLSVVENEANYCATGYYLLGIDQNY
jgi:hypothetical protein